jgi:hypothetical protein
MRIWVKDRFRSEEAGNFTRVRHHLVYGQQRRVGVRCQSITVRVGCITKREDEKKDKRWTPNRSPTKFNKYNEYY